MSLIKVKKMSFGYLKSIEVLKNINLNIKEREFVCIVGENGSGKSTLAKCILGLNKINNGSIECKYKMGYLPQLTEIQNHFPATVEEIVLSGTIGTEIFKIWYSKADNKKAKDIMEELNIYSIRRKSFSELSGGQKQRVLIARALCTTDKIMILDEPINGLDPKIAMETYELLNRLNKINKMTIIMISHDVDRAIKFCTRIIRMENGEICFDGKPSDYKIGGVN